MMMKVLIVLLVMLLLQVYDFVVTTVRSSKNNGMRLMYYTFSLTLAFILCVMIFKW